VLSAQSGINLNFSVLYVKDLIDEVLVNLETVIKEKNIEIVLDFHPSCKVYADISSVQTILRNIVQNAIKFTEENKKITITAFGHHWTPERMYISVKDEGKGIAPDALEMLNSGKKVVSYGTKGEKGNGLGLIVIQTLLSLNNGNMEITSEQGKGTTFQISLPNPDVVK
jgi:signal transduction histidine kinase